MTRSANPLPSKKIGDTPLWSSTAASISFSILATMPRSSLRMLRSRGLISRSSISRSSHTGTGGMNYLLTVNPQVKIFAPKEGFGVFGASLPGTFYRQDASLPDYMRYYNGKPPQMMTFGMPWPSANFVLIDGVTEAAPGISVIATVSQTPGTLELRELSLAIETPEGLILVVGCSHPGIERIVEASTVLDKHVYAIVGGLHLVTTPDSEIAQIVTALHDKWKVDAWHWVTAQASLRLLHFKERSVFIIIT